jgi:hypothetical protein
MASQTLAGFAEALKIDYLPAVRKQLNLASALLTKVRRNERDVSGQEWRMTAHVGRNSGVGAGTETSLPTAGKQSYKNPYGVVKYNRGRIQVTGPVIKASRNDKGALVRALDSEMKGVTADLKKEINYQLNNDGSATRAVINGDPGTATTVTLDGVGTMYLFDGQIVDILDPATGNLTTSGNDLTITSVDSATEITMSASVNADVADNDVITMANATDEALTSREMMGIKGIADDGTFVDTLHNLSRTSFAYWKCSTHTNDSNAGTKRDLTLPLMQAALSAVEKNGGEVTLIMGDHDMRDAYGALVVADKRHVNTMELDGGYTGLDFNGKPFVAEVDCPPNTIFFLSTNHLEIMQMGDWDWMDKDGSVLSRVAGEDAYEAVLTWYSDFVTDKPRAHSFLRDVQ